MKIIIKFPILLFVLMLLNPSCVKAQKTYNSDNPAYIIYNSNGRQVTYKEMINSVSSVDICLFGELHNDPISHWLEHVMVKDLYEMKKGSIVVGAEMWERDNQLILNEMMAEKVIDLNTYIESSILWQNFKNDYLPILKYAQENDIKFIATNVPRRYARIVSKKGDESLDSLTDEAKKFIAPLPIKMDLKDDFYVYISDVFKETQQSPMTGNSLTNFVKAQMVKDATMAYSIVENMPKNGLFFHFNGELHSAFRSGIGYYLKHYNSSLKFKTISIIKKSNIFEFNSKESRADFNIVIPNNMSVTYGN